MKKNVWKDAIMFSILNHQKYKNFSELAKAYANKYLANTSITIESNNGKETIKFSNSSYNDLEYTVNHQNNEPMINKMSICLDTNNEKISVELQNNSVFEILLQPLHKNKGVLSQEYKFKNFVYKNP